jgi:hypothetical protein
MIFMILKKIKQLFSLGNNIDKNIVPVLKRQEKELENIKFLFGQMMAANIKSIQPESFDDIEFKVFSQFGDDGIIQYLIKKLDIQNQSFIEFGVEDYQESNTRFLLMNNNWKGLVIDGDTDNINHIKEQDYYWKHTLTAVSSFVNKENINEIFITNRFINEIGILSIDIDGNDYWIWEAINSISPELVIIEYNNVFGKDLPITIPYNPTFYRTNAHYSNLYWGASLAALDFLANKKGYFLIGSNNAGNNAYFARKDKAGKIKQTNVISTYRESAIRESRNQDKSLSFLSGQDKIKEIAEMPVVNVITKDIFKLKDLEI